MPRSGLRTSWRLLTPGSVAGVNRRVHRRAYRRGAAPPQWARLPTVIIAAVLIGAEVFAIVGTDPTLHGEFKCKWRRLFPQPAAAHTQALTICCSNVSHTLPAGNFWEAINS